MIGKIIGKVDLIQNNYVVVDVNGVGYQIFMTETALGQASQQKEVELFIHTYVREDQISLFGFFSQKELMMFELLISISGIGPKAALGILTIASPDTIKTAILNGNASILTRVSGVGKKTAERVILELSNKIGDLPLARQQEAQTDQEVLEALMAMGYSVSEAREALKAVPSKTKDVSEKIKIALKAMKKSF